jgi:hypothetical protein
MVLTVKYWMKNIDVANGLFLILKCLTWHVNSNFNNKKCQLKLKINKKITQFFRQNYKLHYLCLVKIQFSSLSFIMFQLTVFH